jgi:hypothetical protein
MYADMWADELAEWDEFFAIDPQGTYRSDYQIAQICQQIKVGYSNRSGLMEHLPFQKQFFEEPETDEENLAAMQSIWCDAVNAWSDDE